MSRTIIRVSPNSDGNLEFELFSPSECDDALPTLLSCTQNHTAFKWMNLNELRPDDTSNVMTGGRFLYEELLKNSAVSCAFTQTLAIQRGSVAPICIYLLASGNAEALPWETLCRPQSTFLALNEQWPIARITSRAHMTNIERAFEPPLKVTIIISTTDRDETHKLEWEALYNALKNANIKLALQVFVCQEGLQNSIKEIHDERIQVELLRNSKKREFLDAVKKFNPHILHFFCHGSAEYGPYLRLATFEEWTRKSFPDEEGENEDESIALDEEGENIDYSIALESNELQPLANRDSHIWLVTLNCCQGATSVNGVRSFARALVDGKFPAVIGMREPITNNDAHVFCRAFYSAFVQRFEQWLTEREGTAEIEAEIEWEELLYTPRALLCDNYSNGLPRSAAAARNREWTLPIIYVRPETFKLRIPSTNDLLFSSSKERSQAILNEKRKYREHVAPIPGTPPDVLTDIDRENAEVEALVYPNKHLSNKFDSSLLTGFRDDAESTS